MITNPAKITLASMVLFSLAIIAACYSTALAQDQPQQPPPATTSDPIEQLRLTPDQRQRIRVVRDDTRQERAIINQRQRETNIALQQAIDADPLDELLIEQRLQDAAAAQAASMRLRIQTEIRIRRILTREQLATLRVLQLQAQGLLRDRNADQRPGRDRNTRPNEQNGAAPLFPRRNVPPRAPRP